MESSEDNSILLNLASSNAEQFWQISILKGMPAIFPGPSWPHRGISFLDIFLIHFLGPQSKCLIFLIPTFSGVPEETHFGLARAQISYQWADKEDWKRFAADQAI